MNPRPHLRSVKCPEAKPALLTLAADTSLSVHLREALQGLLALCSGLERPLAETLSECEKQLIRLADKAPNNELQNRYFDSVNKLKRGRAEFAPRVLQHIEDSLARLRGGAASPSRPLDLQPAKYQLALVDGAASDEAVVVSDIATKAELRMREPLYALGHRLGVLTGGSRFSADTMPLGPRALVDAVRFGSGEWELTLEHQFVLYRCFERVALNDTTAFYTALNNYLIEHGILRYLHVLPERAESGATAAANRTTDTAHLANGPSGGAAPPAESSGAVPPVAHEDAQAQDLFGGLRRLLGECRRAEAHTASNTELQSVLFTLQQRQAAATAASKPALYAGEQIKTEVLAALHEISADGRAPRIDDEDGDTIDLIAMLFEFLSRCARSGGVTYRALAKLQMPVLRAALDDKNFFSNRMHPARRLLDSIVEVGRYWVDELDADADPALVVTLNGVVDQVATQFAGEVVVFADALRRLLEHVAVLTDKVEIAERRHVDAARGQEKLESARQQASAAVRERIAKKKPNEFVRTLLEHAWVDALAVSLLREADGHGSYTRRLEALDQLLALASSDGEPMKSTPTELRDETEAGLIQAGLHETDIRAIARRLFPEAGADDDENPMSQTELAIKLRGKAKFGTGRCSDSLGEVDVDEVKTLRPEERAARERLCNLPHGVWLEFVVNPQGDTVRRKLSWYSGSTGRCLVLNRRGAPIGEPTLDALAREVVGGRVRVVLESEQTSLVERAWSAIGDTLKHFSAHRQGYYYGVRVAQSAEPSREAIESIEQPAPSAAPTLLLVDDEANILRALTRVLRVDGYRILTATSAKAGLELLREQDVQVIISDQRMPEVSGTEFLAQVKEAFPNTLRIILSGYSDVAAVTTAINRGVIYKFLTKPWNDEELRLEIRNAFRAHEARSGCREALAYA